MKKSLLLASSLLALALTGSAFAATENASTVAAPAPLPRPDPVSVVNPTDLPLNFAGTTVDIKFSLDASGHPQDIQVLWVRDPVLKRQVVAAFRQWRFTPSTATAAANSKRYILPLEIRAET
jgi:hypothetical protein